MDVAVYDKARDGYRIFIGDLGNRIGKYELEREFKDYGPITDTWVARNPPGFAFLVFKYAEDAESAVRKLHGRRIAGRRIRVEHARPFEERRRLQIQSRRDEYRRPRYSRSRSMSRDRDRSRSRDKKKSRKSKRDRSRSRSRSTSRSKSRRNSKRSRSKSKEKVVQRSRSCSKSPEAKQQNGESQK